MADLQTRLAELKKEIAAFTAETQKKNKAFFQEAVKSLFETFPVVESFSWSQYTPYFNDGDTCEFSAHTSYFTLNGDHDGTYGLKRRAEKLKASPAMNAALEVQIADLDAKKKTAIEAENFTAADKYKQEIEKLRSEIASPGELEKVEKLIEAYDAIKNILEAFDDDAYKMLFGDHVKVTVTKDKISVDEYEHD